MRLLLKPKYVTIAGLYTARNMRDMGDEKGQVKPGKLSELSTADG